MNSILEYINKIILKFYCLLGMHLDIDATTDSRKHVSFYLYCKNCKWKKLRYYTGIQEKLEKEFRNRLNDSIELELRIL